MKIKAPSFLFNLFSLPFFTRALPVLVVLAALILLGYPVALLFGLPATRQKMANLRNWEQRTYTAAPVGDAGATTTLTFPQVPKPSVLVEGAPLAVSYSQKGHEVTLKSVLPQPLVTWDQKLRGPLDAAKRVFQFDAPEKEAEPVYVGDTLQQPGSVEARELPDGQRTTFTFPAASGPVLVDDQVLLEGKSFSVKGNQVTFQEAPAFGSKVRRISGDYAVLDANVGTIAFAAPVTGEVRAASSVVRLAERLSGRVDGENRTFRLGHPHLLETDPTRQIYLNATLLQDTPERPRERVDSERRTFTFASDHGIVTVNGQTVQEGSDYSRDGATVTFNTPPARNAALRQYRDYYVSNPAQGTITLAQAPPAGSVLWARVYTVYSQPSCGTTVLQCFLTLPQYPVPFPNWIAARIIPFFSQYPLADPRNIVRAVGYTTLGTLAALGLGGAFGIVLAVLFVLLRPLERALLPWVVASQTVPIIALVPVLLLILGNFGITIQTSLLPTAIIGAYIAFFPVVVGTVKGLRSASPLALDLMKSYAASPLQVFMKVRFPAATPFLFTSLKLGTAAALVGALVAETESNNRRGLGYAILGQVQAGAVADVWLLLIISALLGIGLVALVGLVQRLVAPWERG